MPGFAIQVGATIQCPHGGQATIIPTNQRVKVNGMSVAVIADQTTIAGCPFQVPIGTGTKPQPCVKVVWQAPATRVKVQGQFVLLQSSVGLCQSAEQIPQGNAIVSMTQTHARAM